MNLLKFIYSSIRVIIGAFHGVVHPALYFLFKKWFPKQEQSTALSMLLLGTSLGLILNVPIADAITYIDMKNGWQLLFYGGSLLHLIWIVLWVIFITDEPGSHHMIKDKEICYIRQNSQNILETVKMICYVSCILISYSFRMYTKRHGNRFFVQKQCMHRLQQKCVGHSIMQSSSTMDHHI